MNQAHNQPPQGQPAPQHPQQQPPIRVLLVEDNPADARLLVESLKDAGRDAFRVTHVSRLAEAAEALTREAGAAAAADVVALDLSLPDSTGLETVRRVQAAAPGVAIVVLTGLQDEALALEALRRGVQDYLVKGQCEGGLAARALRYAVQRRQAEFALRESDERFRTLADGSPALIWVNGPDGAEFVNRAYLDFLGVASETEVRGYDWAQFIHPEDRAPYIDAYLDCVKRRCTFRAQFRFRRRDGEYRWMASTGLPRFTPSGELLGYVGSTTDITDIREAQDALRDREARLSAIVDSAVDSIITIDSRGIIESVNPATEHLFGYARDELIGRNVAMLMPEPYAGEHDGYIANYLRTGVAKIIGIGREVMALRKDGTTFPVTLSVSEFELGGRRMFTGIHHDISNRRRLEREILEASAAEQRRIGHDLHDGLCQQILGVSFGVEVLAQRLKESAPKEVPAVRKLEELLNDTLRQARALSHGLNPIDVRAGGLAKALHDLCARVSDAFAVKCQFEGDMEDGEFTDDTTAVHLYRIAQESISNAIKHGRAKRIRVALSRMQRGGLTLAITDDGSGLPAEPNPRAGRGLAIMQYRAAIIGATLAVRAAAEKGGVAVTCSLRIASSSPEKPAPEMSPAKPPRSRKSPPPTRRR